MFRILLLFVLISLVPNYSLAQEQVIKVKNASFEGFPHRGVDPGFRHTSFSPIPHWTDCGFVTETPPDLHNENSGFFKVKRSPQHGNTFIGMVVRSNESWERVSQNLEDTLFADGCYQLSIYLSKDLNYTSKVQGDKQSLERTFNQPCVLRIHGGNGYCSSKELLSESEPINHTDWRRYDFILHPKKNWTHIELEAFYKTPALFPYNGNILLDNLSDIREIKCPEVFLEAIPPQPVEVKDNIAVIKPPKRNTPTTPVPPTPKVKKEIAKRTTAEKEKILKQLDRKTLKEGQTIKIDRLYFSADKVKVDTSSFDVLDEIYEFLLVHPDVVIEVGGHTNSLPKTEYCDILSSKRAKAVVDYLSAKGISEQKLKAKGYGKRKPLSSNKTKEGRRKNQRVEIKILSLQGLTE